MAIEELLPGLDYLGAAPDNCLRLCLPDDAVGIRLVLGTAVPEVLNLQSVRLIDDDGLVVPMQGPDFRIRLSSIFNDADDAYGESALRRGLGIHSKAEVNPSLFIEWKGRRIRSVEVLNRRDQFGQRSRSLRVGVKLGGEWRELYAHDHVRRLNDVLGAVSKYVAPADWHEIFTGNGDRVRGRVIDACLDEVGRSPSILEGDLSWLAPLLDVYGGGEERDVQLVSVIFANHLLTKGTVSDYSLVRKVLASADRLRRSEEIINSFMLMAGKQAGYTYTRHGLKRSALLSRAEEYLALMGRVGEALAGLGFESFISYGTLLGAVREKSFIPHDDDVDLVYVGKSPDPSDTDERQGVIQGLRSMGFTVTEQLPVLNFLVADNQSGGVFIDVFPSWFDGHNMYLYMERMAIRPVPASVILPLGSQELYGLRFAAPGSREGFLVERYGNGWGSPDRFHEWPYPLASIQ